MAKVQKGSNRRKCYIVRRRLEVRQRKQRGREENASMVAKVSRRREYSHMHTCHTMSVLLAHAAAAVGMALHTPQCCHVKLQC